MGEWYEEPGLYQPGNAYLFDARDGRLTARLIFSGIPADAFIKSVQYSEKNHILFIGTDSKGLIVINENRVEPKRRSDINPRNRNSYYAQIELDNGNILTNEGDIIGNSREPVSLPFKGKFTFNISITQDSLLWFSTLEPDLGHSCLHKFNRISRRITRYPELRADGVIAVSGKENFFASINGIYKLEADSFITLVRSSVQLFNNPVTDFKEIEPGKLAVATCGGLFRFNIRENKLDTLLKKEAGCIRTIWKYKEYVFLGSYGSGFFIYKNGIFKKMPVDKNKYLLYTHCFIPDDFGYCWISTNRGLFKASLKELLEAYENDTRTVYYHYFGKKDGMDMTELNGGCTPCALQMKNKTISFPSMDGLLWVNPEKARPVLPEGGIYIDEFLVNGRNLPPDSLDQVYLPANTNEIYIRLGYAAWCNKENIYLDYQLNDTMNWKTISTNDDAVIRLVGLPSGKHLLRIRKLNGFGIDNYSYSEIRFTILTPWYKQWWFYLLILFAILGIASLYSQIRNKQLLKRERKLEQQVAEKTSELKEQNEILEKNNSIKTRLISIISHDIVTPLKFVTVAGKNLIEKRALMPEELQQETIREMTNTAQELQLLSTNILNWIKYQNENRRLAKETFSLNDMINQVIGVISSLAKQKKIRLVNTTDPDLKIHQYFEPLKILVYNLLTNAINFSEKGDIVISVKPAEGMVILSVSDEGVGMTAEQIKNVMADQFIISSNNIDNKKGNGLGYLIIKDLVKMMDARLVINSRKNEGTTVSVYVPDGLSG
ncbi:MAG: HAMP domain-containing histidine kinase [Chitinophagaceae bacterium]|nr:HAMP domain-containing histidine kinase [Chitinophagaceae bacterium]